MKLDKSTGKNLAIYALILGIFYLVFGFREVIANFTDYELETEPIGMFGGFALMIIAVVYFFSITELRNGRMEGLAFLVGALILSAIFGILYILIMGANGLDYLVWLGTEDEIGTTFREDFGPAIWLFLISLPLAFMIKSKGLIQKG